MEDGEDTGEEIMVSTWERTLDVLCLLGLVLVGFLIAAYLDHFEIDFTSYLF